MTLNPSKPPGDNFNLLYWELDTPVKDGSSVLIIPGTELAKGYTSEYLYTNKTDGSMVFWCPADGATTPNTKYPRSELRETPAGGDWSLYKGTNTLTATCKVVLLPAASSKGIYIGQIHGDNSSDHPEIAKLLWSTENKVSVQIQESADPGTEKTYDFSDVTLALGEEISYVLKMTSTGTDSSELSVSVTQTSTGKLVGSMTALFSGEYWTKQSYYFKAGAYVQEHTTNTKDAGSVQFYALTATHV